MDKVGKKGKKKHVKDEVDRQKQAEKKRRRLEKALANSAAIRSELEKKKQRKKEEQQRLDEEGAAIAEAVALHVLCDEEDTQVSHHFLINNDSRIYNLWDHSRSISFFMDGCQNFACSPKSPFYEEICQGAEISAGLMASLQIAEDARVDRLSEHGAATFVFNRMFEGDTISDAVNFYKEL